MLFWLVFLPFSAAGEVCDHGVSFSNGHTTKGLTATVTCKDRDSGALRRKVPLVDGERHGLLVWYDEKGRPSLEEEYASGELHGEKRRYQDGVLESVDRYHEGRTRGQKQSRYHADGSIRSEEIYTEEEGWSKWRFTASGQLRNITCGGLSLGKRHAAWCSGKRGVELYDEEGRKTAEFSFREGLREGPFVDYYPSGEASKRGTWVAGEQRGKLEEWRPDGTLSLRAIVGDDDRYLEKTTYHPDGKVIEEHLRFGDDPLFESYWMNGEMSQRRVPASDGVEVTRFHDNGKKAMVGTFSLGSRCAYSLCPDDPLGTHSRFDERGRLVAEEDYENGRVVASRTFDPKTGKLEHREAYHPDGSRKR